MTKAVCQSRHDAPISTEARFKSGQHEKLVFVATSGVNKGDSALWQGVATRAKETWAASVVQLRNSSNSFPLRLTFFISPSTVFMLIVHMNGFAMGDCHPRYVAKEG